MEQIASIPDYVLRHVYYREKIETKVDEKPSLIEEMRLAALARGRSVAEVDDAVSRLEKYLAETHPDEIAKSPTPPHFRPEFKALWS